jgi:hypothetical protein
MATPQTPQPASRSVLKRYAPFIVVVVLLAVVVLVIGLVSNNDDDNNGSSSTTTQPGANSDLPLTFQEAQAQGTEGDIDWGDGCDTTTGRLKIPVHNAPPCVEPWDDSQDNGGATSRGVTADEIVIAVYQGEPDPLQQAIVEGAGADTDPTKIAQTRIDYLNMFADMAGTYGRKLRVEVVKASGGPTDATAALADAQKVIDMGAFAAIDGPAQTPAWQQELVDNKIICMCGTAESQPKVIASAPYLWPTGPTPEQADAHLLELVGKQLVGKNAEFAGDEAMHSKSRVFGWVQAETETGEYQARVDAFAKNLKDEYDGEIAATSTYLFDPNNAGQIAETVIARMKQAGVTTIIISTDPLIPKQITEEATKQNYFPEWVIGPSVLADTTIFGRTFDQRQWAHAIGLGIPTARTDREQGDSFTSYKWYYGKDVPVNSQAVLYPASARLALGIYLAGPKLTPETFRDGMFRWPPIDGQITAARVSWGNDEWPEVDYNDQDDATAVWWDPDATGQDEAGNEGKGMLRYVDGGKRYLPGEWPTDPIPWFVKEGSVTVYDETPDPPKQYPAWPGSPAAQK